MATERRDAGGPAPGRAPRLILTAAVPPPSGPTSADSVRRLTDPVPLREAVAEVLERSDEYDAWLARLERGEAASYERGRADGIIIGRRLEATERDQAWARFAGPIARGGPSFAELEIRRWGPGGREHFADPQPGDYMGGPVAPW